MDVCTQHLLSLAGSSVLGVTLLIKRFRPVLPALLLAAAFPVAITILQVTSLGSVSLPLAFAFGLLGRWIARQSSAEVTVKGVGRPDMTAAVYAAFDVYAHAHLWATHTGEEPSRDRLTPAFPLSRPGG
jgi:hypothetical protein